MDIQKENFNAHIMATYGEHVIWNGDKPIDIRYDDLWITWQQAQKMAVPEGFVLVPREPTEAMMISALAVISTGIGKDHIDVEINQCWKKMIEAQEQVG